mmetsp:Transcript_36840/g.42413  ORF Transcript_36840/g.42413 Transcript_36840/m.42413 type:complete len:510 (-) Transcript_36840:31-1560(-)
MKDNHIFDDRNSNCNDDDALFLCRQARKLWLQNATMREDLDRVENLYRQALNSKREIITETTMTSKRSSKEKVIKNNQKRKRNKQQAATTTTTTKKKTIAAALSKEEYRKAAERLSLLYLQSGRSYKATPGLKYLNFECRLSERILNYPTNTNTNNTTNGNKNKSKNNNKNLSSSASASAPKPPCCVVDDFLSPNELHHLRRVFGDTSSSYWKDHNYVIDKEPPAPYFSYVIDLKQQQKKEKNPPAFLRTIIDKILHCDLVSAKFPNLPHDARYVELWAHNRPHASGHQLHFDSDDEGRGGVPRHPIVSTVLYLSSHSKVGGPTLVTNQRLRNPTTTNLNSVHGWLVACKPARLVCFEGSVLHGVIPGKGPIPPSSSNIHNNQQQQQRPRRVTLMMAFWKNIKIRQGTNPGSARPWPTTTPAKTSCKKSRNKNESRSWKIELNRTDIDDFNTNEKEEEGLPQQKWDQDRQQIIPIRYVYESLDGIPVPKYVENGDGLYMPEYDRVFQGF